MPVDAPTVPVVTDVAIQEADGGLVLADEKLSDLASSLGLIGVPGNIIKKLRDLGCVAQGLGVTAVAQGGMMHTELAVADVISKLQNKASESESVRELREIAQSLGYLAGKRSINHKLMVESVDPVKDEQKTAQSQRSNSWTPGQILGPTVNVNVNPGASVTIQDGSKPAPGAEKPA